MTFQAVISKCKHCEDKFLQTRKANNICDKEECKTKNKQEYNKRYKERLKNGTLKTKTYKAVVYDSATPEVRWKNKFILACNAR